MDYYTIFKYNAIPNLVFERNTYQILDVNDRAIDFYEHTKSQFLSKTILDLFTKKDISLFEEAHEKINEPKGNIQFGIFTQIKKNGEKVQMEITGHLIEFAGKKCVMLNCQEFTDKNQDQIILQNAKNILDASLDVISSIDEEGKFISVSAASKKHWGYFPEELEGRAYLDLVHPEDIKKTNEAATEILAGNDLTTFENRYIKKNGEIAYNLWSAHWDPISKVMYTVTKDATEKRKNEQFLIESESRFKSLVQEGLDLIGILDGDGNYSYVSPTSKAVLGIEPEEFIGRSPLEFIHPDDIEKIVEYLNLIATQQRVEITPFRFQNNKKEWRWIKTILTNMLDHPSIKGIVANSRDITEQVEEQNRLKLLESVILNTTDAVLITDAEPQKNPDPKILFVNDAFTKMTGYSVEEVLGKSPRFLQGQNSDRKELDKLKNAIRNLQPCEISTINYKKNGEEFWVNFKISPVANDKGCFTHWIAIERDITEFKNEEKQKELLAKISIEFNKGTDLYSSLNSLCKVMVEYGKFNFCEIWLPSVDKKTIKLYSKYSSDTKSNKFFEFSADQEVMDFGIGLPGSVWKENKIIVWDNLKNNKNFIRKIAVEKSGVNAVLGLPLKHNDTIVGVMNIGSSRNQINQEQHAPVLVELETFIGSEINRKKLEADLSHLFEALPDLICLADFDGNFIKINQAGCDILEFKENELMGKPFSQFIHPDDNENLSEVIKELNENETNFKFENRYITKTGKIIWLSWHCNSNLNEGFIYAIAKNITNEKKLKELVDDASKIALIGGWEIDIIANALSWSDIVHEIHETDPKVFIPEVEKAIDFYRSDYKDFVNDKIDQAISNGNAFDFEAPLLSAKGNEKWVRAIGQIEKVDGRLIRVYGSFQDITSIKATQQRLESITNDLPGVTFQYYMYPDGKDKLESVSKTAIKIWGFTPEECEQNSAVVWDQIKKGGDFDLVAESIQNSIKNKTQWHPKYRVLNHKGEIRFHEGYCSPHFLPDGTVVFNSMVFDITEEKKALLLNEQTANLAAVGSWELSLKNQSGDAMYWSPLIRQILEVDENYDPSLSGGFEFYVEESRKKIEEVVKNLIENKIPFDEELLVKSSKGNFKWIRCIGDGDFSHNECLRIYGSYQDINDKKTTQLRLSEILESISDAFYALDDHWEFIFFNKEAEKLLEKKNEDVIGQNMWKIFPDAKGTELETVFKKVKKTGISERFEYLYPGDNSWYEINVYSSQNGISVYFKNINERINSALALQKAFKEKNNIVESIADAFFTIDKNFIVTYWNKSAEDMMNVKREQLIGNNLWEVFPDAVTLPSYKNYHEALKTGQPITFEDFYGIWLEVNAYPSEEGLTVIFRDINHRKVADERLKKAYEERNQILESIGDAFFAVDNDWVVTYWNRVAQDVLLKSKEEIIGKILWEEYADAVDSEFYRMYHKAKDNNEIVSFEEYYPALNKWFEVTAYPNPNGLSVYFRDVTLRKEKDQIVKNANERFEKVTQATSDAIWDWDIENNIFFRGNGYEKLFGYKVKKNLNDADFWKDRFHPEDLPSIKQSLEASLENVKLDNWQSEYRIIHESGEIKTVIDKGMIIRDANGKAIRMVGAITDISDRKKHELELKELNKILKNHAYNLELSNEQLEQFAFIASHDLQEPLRMISSFLNQLQRKYNDKLDEKAQQYIHFATDGAKRMKQIILDLLEYSRTGKHLEKEEVIDAQHIIDDFMILRRKVIQEKNVIFKVDHLPIIECHKTPLIQTIHCILDNAIKYSKENVQPQIEISVHTDDKQWVFKVKDNGIGIKYEFFDKIFVIFQRLHNRDVYEGTGLGLSVAKKNVESWGGKIWVESELTKGSTFYFSINKN